MSSPGNQLAVFALCSLAAWPAQLSLPRPFDVQGSTLAVPVLFLSQADSVSNVQFDLEYDSSVINLTAVVGEAARVSGKVLASSDVTPNRKRFLLAGLNQTPIPDGALINIFVSLAPNASDGAYTLRFSNVMAADADARPLDPDSVDGAIIAYQVLGPPVPLRRAGVLNRASLLAGPVAPGEVIEVVGSVPADSRLAFDNIPARLLSAPPNELSAIVPAGLTGTTTRMQIMSQGQATTEILLPVVPAAPGVFTADGSGTGQGAILNEDLTPNSAANPAARGSIVTLMATGLGQAPNGLAVRLGGTDCPVLYTEPPDESNPGVVRIKCTVPPDANLGYTVPVTLMSGQYVSQLGVTMAIE